MNEFKKYEYTRLLNYFKSKFVLSKFDNMRTIKDKGERVLQTVVDSGIILSFENFKVLLLNGKYRCKFDVTTTDNTIVSIMVKLQ